MTDNPQPEWLERLRNWLSTDVVPAIALADLNAALAFIDRIYSPPQDVREAVEALFADTDWDAKDDALERHFVERTLTLITEREAAKDAERQGQAMADGHYQSFLRAERDALQKEREAALLTSVQEDIDHAEHLRDEMASRAHEAIAQAAGLRAQLEDKVIEETKEAMALGGNPDDWPTGGEFIARKRLKAERDALAAKLERAREALTAIEQHDELVLEKKPDDAILDVTAAKMFYDEWSKAIDIARSALAETAPDSAQKTIRKLGEEFVEGMAAPVETAPDSEASEPPQP